MPPKILLVLFEGLADTVIESQVLLHARELARMGIAEFEIWAVACFAPLYTRSLAARDRAQALAGCPVEVLRGVRPALPFSTRINARRLARRLAQHMGRFDLVHARTDYSAGVCARLKRLSPFVLVWDCRGDSVAEFAERFGGGSWLSRLARAVKMGLLARQRHEAARVCDRAIFVTEALRALAAADLGTKPSAIIPGAASDELFHFDPALRQEARAGLGLGAQVRLLVYSGSLAPYQCFDETLALYAALRARDPNTRLLVLTPALEEARRRIDRAGIQGVDLRQAPIGEVNRFLNASDAAFMLRAPTDVNRVAFPTKFAEYCLAGLPVIMSMSVPAAYQMARRFGNLIEVRSDGTVAWPQDYDRARVASMARQQLARASVAEEYAKIYRLGSEGAP
jgi:hypothetical protein